jgi:pyridoxal phosphate enzyme (YggS family)
MGIAENLEKINEQIQKACDRSRRSVNEIQLVAVSKTRPVEDLILAYEAGVRDFGENRVIEAEEKAKLFFEHHPDARLHFIGHLQSNKAKTAASISSCIHSVDSVKLVRKLGNALAQDDSIMELPIFIEMNISGEESKYGIRDLGGLSEVLETALEIPGLKVLGLMTMAPYTPDEKVLRDCFSGLRMLLEQACERYPEAALKELSMGMSNDFPIAIEEGATMIRVGTSIFQT